MIRFLECLKWTSGMPDRRQMRIICNNRPMLIRNIYILSFISSNRYDLDTRSEMIKNLKSYVCVKEIESQKKMLKGIFVSLILLIQFLQNNYMWQTSIFVQIFNLAYLNHLTSYFLYYDIFYIWKFYDINIIHKNYINYFTTNAWQIAFRVTCHF